MRSTLTRLLVAAVIALTAMSASAHPKKRSAEERQRWEAEMTRYKHDTFAKELALTTEQQTQFFALYDAMDRERRQLMHSVRKARRELDKKARPTDAEMLQVADLDIQTDRKVKELEWKYYAEFKKVLTPRQLYKLREAEMKYMNSLRKHAGKEKKK